MKTFSFKERFIGGESQYAFWNIISKGAGFSNTFLILTSLTLYQYGVFQLLLSVYSAFTDLLSVGGGVVNNDISRHIGAGEEGKAKKIYKEYAVMRIVAGILLWAGFFFGADLFAERYSVEFVREVRLISFLFLTEVVFTSMRTLISLRMNFAAAASRSAIYKAFQFFILLYFFVFSEIGLRELFLSMIIGSSLSLLFLISPFMRSYRIWKGEKTEKGFAILRLFKSYGKWEVFSQVGSKTTSRIKPWLIKIFISTEAVAIFTVANSAVGAVKDMLPFKTLNVLIPLRVQDNNSFQRIFTYGMKYMALLSIIFMIGGMVLAPIVITFIFPQYIESLPLFFLIISALPIMAVSIVVVSFLITLRKQKFLFLHSVIRNVLGLSFYLILLPAIGIWGLALERFVTPLIVLIISFFYIKKLGLQIRFENRKLFTFGKEDRDFVKDIFKIFKKSTMAKISKLKLS
ncbi:MAG: hypothetical protein COV70_02285 [Parcubacteria group bacterium CG11_big_fil_rev_8_21_14_0_20_39_22]|nr:MAG: hypothetical protein COV70_02285 [Parcubacteria group bacterium CG11_big_fil_rev_8_21_14_0_20_39_22]